MNYNTQNKKIASITEKTLIVGIDVGSTTHYARAFDWRNYEYSKKPFAFSNNEEGFMAFKSWIEDIAKKHGKDKIIPGMEPTGHYWFNLGQFLQASNIQICMVNPYHVKQNKIALDSQIMAEIEELLVDIPGSQELLKIKGIGIKAVAGFIAEVGDIGRFSSAK